MSHFTAPRRRTGLQLALALIPIVAAHAQTNDEARLTLGIAVGYVGSRQLWDVPSQIMYSAFESAPAIFHITRSTNSDISISGQATFFAQPHLGFTGEFTYLGLANSDGCSLVQDDGDAILETACAALSSRLSSASVATVGAGIVYRPLSRTAFQPYLKVIGGLAFTPTSTIETRSEFGTVADTTNAVFIYDDESWHSIRATGTISLGIATAPSSGYQLHVEVRQTFIPFPVVTGPVPIQGQIPPNSTKWTGFTSVLVGFDIVLARRRGRRY